MMSERAFGYGTKRCSVFCFNLYVMSKNLYLHISNHFRKIMNPKSHLNGNIGGGPSFDNLTNLFFHFLGAKKIILSIFQTLVKRVWYVKYGISKIHSNIQIYIEQFNVAIYTISNDSNFQTYKSKKRKRKRKKRENFYLKTLYRFPGLIIHRTQPIYDFL